MAAHIHLRRLPAAALPAGATSFVEHDGTVYVEHADYNVLAAWRLDRVKAGELVLEDCLAGGGAPPERQPVTISADRYAALRALETLPATATRTELLAVRTQAVTAASRS
jgi:hypothetical protein